MECIPCPKGYNAASRGSAICQKCLPARYATDIESEVCTACVNRSWTRELDGQDTCVPCLRGETFAGDRCVLCSEGKYSFIAGESFFGCHQCPDGAECPGGNETRDLSYAEILLIDPGYWKSPGSKRSQEEAREKGECGDAVNLPWQCDVNGKTCDSRNGVYYDECGIKRRIMPCLNPPACIGTKAANFSNNTCDTQKGYMGILCQTCDSRRGFFMTSNGCDTCKIYLSDEISVL